MSAFQQLATSGAALGLTKGPDIQSMLASIPIERLSELSLPTLSSVGINESRYRGNSQSGPSLVSAVSQLIPGNNQNRNDNDRQAASLTQAAFEIGLEGAQRAIREENSPENRDREREAQARAEREQAERTRREEEDRLARVRLERERQRFLGSDDRREAVVDERQTGNKKVGSFLV